MQDLGIVSLIKTRTKIVHFLHDSFGIRGKKAVFGKDLTNKTLGSFLWVSKFKKYSLLFPPCSNQVALERNIAPTDECS